MLLPLFDYFIFLLFVKLKNGPSDFSHAIRKLRRRLFTNYYPRRSLAASFEDERTKPKKACSWRSETRKHIEHASYYTCALYRNHDSSRKKTCASAYNTITINTLACTQREYYETRVNTLYKNTPSISLSRIKETRLRRRRTKKKKSIVRASSHESR